MREEFGEKLRSLSRRWFGRKLMYPQDCFCCNSWWLKIHEFFIFTLLHVKKKQWKTPLWMASECHRNLDPWGFLKIHFFFLLIPPRHHLFFFFFSLGRLVNFIPLGPERLPGWSFLNLDIHKNWGRWPLEVPIWKMVNLFFPGWWLVGVGLNRDFEMLSIPLGAGSTWSQAFRLGVVWKIGGEIGTLEKEARVGQLEETRTEEIFHQKTHLWRDWGFGALFCTHLDRTFDAQQQLWDDFLKRIHIWACETLTSRRSWRPNRCRKGVRVIGEFRCGWISMCYGGISSGLVYYTPWVWY